MKKRINNKLQTVLVNLLAVFAIIPVLFPIYWLFVSAFQSPQTIIQIPPKLFSHTFSLYYLKEVFSEFGVGRFLFNSVYLAVVSTFLTLVVASLAAFSYTVYKYKAKETFSKAILFVNMFPQILIIIPLYLLMSKMGLINSWKGLILCYIAFQMPICVWTIQAYFETIPRELIDAAEIDGLTRLQTLPKIFIPVALPGLAASGIMVFIGVWNNFILANTLLIDEVRKTLPVVVVDFASRDSMFQGDVLAASLIICIPSFMFALFAQKYLVGGLTDGSVKA